MLLLAAAFAAQPIQAAFPCAKAATPQEKLICARVGLAQADVELNRNFEQALARLSPAGRRQLRISQRAWLRFRDAVCPVERSAPAHRPHETCLAARYFERSAELKEAVRQVGPFRVVRLDGYRVWPAPGRSGWYDSVLTNEECFDWIDTVSGGAAQKAAAARWNAALSERATLRGTRWRLYRRERTALDAGSEYGGETQTGRVVEILGASADVVAARAIDYWMGGAHPEEVVSYRTFLVPERRSMTLGDLVGRRQAFRSLAYARLRAQYPRTDFSRLAHVPDIALGPESWEPTAAGLVVHYGTILGRPSGDLTATLRWSEMRPFLSPRGRRIAASFGAQRGPRAAGS